MVIDWMDRDNWTDEEGGEEEGRRGGRKRVRCRCGDAERGCKPGPVQASTAACEWEWEWRVREWLRSRCPWTIA